MKLQQALDCTIDNGFFISFIFIKKQLRLKTFKTNLTQIIIWQG